MENILYNNILLVSAVLFYFFGFYLIFGRVPKRLAMSIYRRSRKVMGMANLILAIVMTLFYFIDIKALNVYYSPIINLVSYFIIAILIALSFIPMLGGGRSHYTFSRIKISVWFWVVYALALWYIVHFCSDRIIQAALVIAAILFLGNTIGLTHLFLLTYRDALKSAENFYSDNIEVSIGWMRHSVYLIIGMGLTGGIAAFGSFAPRWTAIGYLLFTLYVFAYIFVRFIDFMVYYVDVTCSAYTCKDVELIPEEEEEEATIASLRGDIRKNIASGLSKWVEAKGYMVSGVTIQSISNSILTNRTYLSMYINSAYGLTFKDWVTSLRLDEAKRLMLEDKSVTVAEIAHTVGFSSPTSFTRAFTRRESVSPFKWREKAS